MKTPTLTQRFFSQLRRLRSLLRCVLARAVGVEIGVGVDIGAHCDLCLGFEPARRGCIVLGAHTALCDGVVLHPYGGDINIGSDVHLGPGTVIYGHGGVTIGADTLVAMHCRILSSEHAIPDAATIIRSQPNRKLPTRIGRDVWLGAGVTVLGGVTIGDGCVVGAGAVVTRDLPPLSIAAGVPARVVGTRPSHAPLTRSTG